MKSIFILGVFLLLLVMMLLASCKHPADWKDVNTIKANDIKDGAKLFGGEVGLKLDQKTGRIVELMYKGASFVPIHERDSLRKLVKRYRCEFETIQEANEFFDSPDSICCDAVKVRSIDLEEPKLPSRYPHKTRPEIESKNMAYRQAKMKRELPVQVNKSGFVKSTGSVTQLQMETINGIFHSDGVHQMVSYYADGSTILSTYVDVDSKDIMLLYASSTEGVLWHDDDSYFVREVTDSVIRAHRAKADSVYIETIYK